MDVNAIGSKLIPLVTSNLIVNTLLLKVRTTVSIFESVVGCVIEISRQPAPRS